MYFLHSKFENTIITDSFENKFELSSLFFFDLQNQTFKAEKNQSLRQDNHII